MRLLSPAVMSIFSVMILGAAEPPTLPPSTRIRVVLEGAAKKAGSTTPNQALIVELNRSHGVLEPVVEAAARTLHFSDYQGRLLQASLTDSELKFTTSLEEIPDLWSPPGDFYRFEITATRSADGTYVGQWKGSSKGQTGEGIVKANLFPLSEKSHWTAPAPGEHPRLLFRQSDIPALKAKLATPWGQAELKRLQAQLAGKGGPDTEGPTGKAMILGLLYHLTGDKALADQGRSILSDDLHNWYNVQYVHGPAACVSQGALAYDLLYPTADAAWKKKIQAMFRSKLDYLYFPPVGGFNNKDGSNWSAMYRSSLGMAALALLADPVETAAPLPRSEILVLKPLPSPAPKDSVVTPLIDDKAIGAWLHAGPFLVDMSQSVLTEPQTAFVAGSTISYKTEAGEGASCAFAPLATKVQITAEQAKNYQRPELEGGLDFNVITGRRFLTTQIISTLLEVKETKTYQFDHSLTKLNRVEAFLDGQQIRNGDAVCLETGLHRLNMEVAIGACGGHELLESYVRFRPLDEAAQVAWTAKAKRKLEFAQSIAAVDALEKADTQARNWLAVAQRCAEGWVDRSLGDQGWNTEGEAYTQHALRQILLFSHAIHNATGRNLAPGKALQAIFPMYVTKTIFRPDGVSMASYGPGGGPLGVDNWARGFGLIENTHQSVCQIAWDRTQNLADIGKFTSHYSLQSELDGASAVFRFINHPGTPTPDIDPATVLTKTIFDTEKQGFVFRNAWTSEKDSVAAVWVYSTNEPPQSWCGPDMGDLRWTALGTPWLERGIPWGNGIDMRRPGKDGFFPCLRQYGSVVQIPGYKAMAGGKLTDPGRTATPKEGPARLISSTLQNDGSGIVTMDLSGNYMSAVEEEIPGSTKKRTVAKDDGIRAIRSILVDHSGQSGVPAMMVIADKLSGTKGDETWQLATAPDLKITTDGQTFTVTAPDGATMKGTILAPAKASITTAPVKFTHEINYHARHNCVELKRQNIRIKGEGSFFLVVLTVQNGQAPIVNAEAGNATFTVGKQTLGWDGKTLRFGK